MVKHPAVRKWVRSGLISQIEGLYVEQRLKRRSDTPATALAMAGFKNTTPFLDALEGEPLQTSSDKRDTLTNPLAAEMTFNNFAQTSSYMSAVELLLRVCRDSPFQSKFTAIYGGEGQGKTHLLNATELETGRSHPERQVVLVNMLDLAIAFIRARRRGVRSDFIEYLCQLDTLLVDDVQLCEASSQIQADLLEVVEKQPAQMGHRLVLSCDVKPGQLQLHEGRLLSVFEKVVSVELQPLDRIEKGLLIVKFSGGSNLPVEVRNYIAENVTGNVGELKAAVIQLIAASKVAKREISLQLASEILSLARSHPQKPEMEPDGSVDSTVTGARGTSRSAQLLKDMIQSAQNNAEYSLANQIALSQMIRVLNSDRAADKRPLKARLKLALQAVRERDMVTASELIQGPAFDTGQDGSP
jgi:chromosomal replication initiation ATPase DnaA